MGEKPLLLIVDDNEDFHEQFSLLADMAGYEVESILDGGEALKRVEAQPIPSLVLLDLFLPHASGDEILAAMRASPAWEHVPVYLLTADLRTSRAMGEPLPKVARADGILEKGSGAIATIKGLLKKHQGG